MTVHAIQTVHSENAQRLVILGTGGTIAGRAAQAGDNVGYVAGQVSVGDLVAAVPTLKELCLDVEQVAQLDSKDMGFSVWKALAARVAFHLERPDVKGLVITHGTDTLEETAFFLQSVLKPTKPVVLTCAMRPATALVPDGPQNLSDAVAVARHTDAQGVVVVCAGQVHCADDVTKVHTYRLDAFDSGDAGPLGCVEEGAVRLFRPWPLALAAGYVDASIHARVQASLALPRVVMLTSHADMDGLMVEALLAQSDSGAAQPLRGIVVAGTGNGTLHKDLEAALLKAQAQGIRVVLTSRCIRGRVLTHLGQRLSEVSGLSPVKSRIALALALLAD
ncbi:MAG: asparaginase [Hydrogenophaga sp.]|uniref:asparaginase n=1 Tax=Hydrogenophaga sp. TaxID=1904254 RepID=UPI0027661EC2|nr:asparaginase [Hydrogenophaga sp.]MDP2417884.1 asparaginase [Hydrogenophaga sp.]MDZ4189967.1 asparaginase [Hydrogenophaga sp.]